MSLASNYIACIVWFQLMCILWGYSHMLKLRDFLFFPITELREANKERNLSKDKKEHCLLLSLIFHSVSAALSISQSMLSRYVTWKKKLISEPGKVKAWFLFVALPICLNTRTPRFINHPTLLNLFSLVIIWSSFPKKKFFMYFVKSHLKQRGKCSSQTGFVFTPYWALWLWSSKAFKVSLSLSIIPLKLVAWSMYFKFKHIAECFAGSQPEYSVPYRIEDSLFLDNGLGQDIQTCVNICSL